LVLVVLIVMLINELLPNTNRIPGAVNASPDISFDTGALRFNYLSYIWQLII
jgi:hypothetical protein